MRLNIQYKLTLVIITVVTAILSGLFFYLNVNLRADTYQKIRKELQQKVDLTKKFLNYSYNSNQSLDQVDSIADEIGSSLGLRATILDLKGKVLGDSKLDISQVKVIDNHSNRPEIQQAIALGFGEKLRFSSTVSEDMLYMASQFGFDKNEGIVRLAIRLIDIEKITKKLMWSLLTTFAIALFVTFGLGLIVAHYITKPIIAIAHVAEDIAQGDYSRKASEKSNDEISDLAKAINYMSKQINLRLSEAITNKSRFEAVLLSMFEGVMVIDHKSTILLMNNALKKSLQISEDPIGKRPLEVVRNIEIQEMIDEVFKVKERVVSKEITVLFPEEKILQVHGTCFKREHDVDGAVLVFHDMTEIKRLERIRQDFVANVSHELRTPITNIQGYSETLLHGALDDKKNAEEFLGIIHSDSKRLAQLVDDLLELSKIESGKVQLKLQQVNVREVFNRLFIGYKKMIQSKKLIIRNNISDTLPSIMVDENSISQVFLNIIENAIKYNVDGGHINIDAFEEGDNIRIEISDSGCGISKEDVSRVFERFYRVDKARSRDVGGTGLGLSIAKHIVNIHRGDLSVVSELTKGSTFIIILPKS